MFTVPFLKLTFRSRKLQEGWRCDIQFQTGMKVIKFIRKMIEFVFFVRQRKIYRQYNRVKGRVAII